MKIIKFYFPSVIEKEVGVLWKKLTPTNTPEKFFYVTYDLHHIFLFFAPIKI